ncbi:hypothetical protein PSR1_04464 [Anaeromyxobacter sp. PSR-1]|nr:hypothetical protein PSR1_04464 [Anaeromyxobacter sp. PSR-1]
MQHALGDEQRLGRVAGAQLGDEPVAPLLRRDGGDAHGVEPGGDVRVGGGPADLAPGRPVDGDAVDRPAAPRHPRRQQRGHERVRAGVVGLPAVAEARHPGAERHHRAERVRARGVEEVQEPGHLGVEHPRHVRVGLAGHAGGPLHHGPVAQHRDGAVPRADVLDHRPHRGRVGHVADRVLEREPLALRALQVAVQLAVPRQRVHLAREADGRQARLAAAADDLAAPELGEGAVVHGEVRERGIRRRRAARDDHLRPEPRDRAGALEHHAAPAPREQEHVARADLAPHRRRGVERRLAQRHHGPAAAGEAHLHPLVPVLELGDERARQDGGVHRRREVERLHQRPGHLLLQRQREAVLERAGGIPRGRAEADRAAHRGHGRVHAGPRRGGGQERVVDPAHQRVGRVGRRAGRGGDGGAVRGQVEPRRRAERGQVHQHVGRAERREDGIHRRRRRGGGRGAAGPQHRRDGVRRAAGRADHQRAPAREREARRPRRQRHGHRLRHQPVGGEAVAGRDHRRARGGRGRRLLQDHVVVHAGHAERAHRGPARVAGGRGPGAGLGGQLRRDGLEVQLGVEVAGGVRGRQHAAVQRRARRAPAR